GVDRRRREPRPSPRPRGAGARRPRGPPTRHRAGPPLRQPVLLPRVAAAAAGQLAHPRPGPARHHRSRRSSPRTALRARRHLRRNPDWRPLPAPMSRAPRSLLSNTFASGPAIGWTAVVTLGLTPFLIRQLGAPAYGV